MTTHAIHRLGGVAIMALVLGACGHTTEQKAATGAVAGAVVAGPVGAVAGAAAGAAAQKVEEHSDQQAQSPKR